MIEQKKQLMTALIIGIFTRLMAFLVILVSALVTTTSFLEGFSHWDSINYLDICKHGSYALPEVGYPESIKLFAFYPMLPVVYCTASKILNNNVLLAALLVNTICFFLLCKELYVYLCREYKDESLRSYLFMCFLFFPFSWFLQVNYTETIFLWLTLLSINLIHSQKIWLSHLAALFAGLTRSTAFATAAGNWIIYTKEFFKSETVNTVTDKEIKNNRFYNKSLKEMTTYIINSMGFLSYGMGTVALLTYFQFTYGDWHVFFKSQKEFYGRQTSLDFWQGWLKDLTMTSHKWFIHFNQNTYNRLGSENFLDNLITQQTFNTYFLLYFPLILAFIGSAYLVYKKQYDKLAWSWLILIMPIMTGETTSINRYLIGSFPLLFAVFEIIAKNKTAKIIWLVFSVLLWILVALWFSKGFWVG